MVSVDATHHVYLLTLLVHHEQHEQQVQDLTAAKESQDRQIEILERRCQALEDEFKGIKKNTKSNKAIQTDKPQPAAHQSTGQRIHTTKNNGRYTTTTPSSQHPLPPSTTSRHAPTPPDTVRKQDPVPASQVQTPAFCPFQLFRGLQ